MTETLRQFMIFFRYLGLISANKSKINRVKKKQLFKDYLKFKMLTALPNFLKSKITSLRFLGHQLSFFDLATTTALIVSIFIENEYFFKTKNKRANIIDLGSNIGLSIIYLKFIYPSCSVLAYEADPVTFKVLQNNICSFRIRNVKVNNSAITNKTGSVDFYTALDGDGSPLMSTNALRIANKKTIKVKSVKLSSIIQKKIDFLKMDVEGSEMDILDDLNKSNKMKLIDQMSIEYHHHIDTNQDNFSRFLKLIETNNFGYQLHASQNTPFTLKVFEDIQVHTYNKNV